MFSFDKVEQSLEAICDECSYINTNECSISKCSIGFPKLLIKHAKDNSVIVVDDGDKLIPNEDFKYYSQELIADSIGEICKLCRECRENHNEQSIISLCRHSLESTVLSEPISYSGSTLMYIMQVSNQNQSFAEMIKKAYEKK